ncbi:mannitol dehydrogenase family protein [Vibrio marisflavi]|uniref:Polyol:NADP oxidoreductase n=1 Tax=Vibrio marisflavi CECT 7928 TaxID=634439 RepID=A0ABM9A158_9VIBR|nr:fructuronate reductase [Vibrio marisflavi]CAH0537317.1 Polyol:NADP oxidoreductase [Vibrio marisflavi CECT 7928]
MHNISNTKLNEEVRPLQYDRSSLKTRIIHLGCGAFHRAHQAVFTDEVLSKTQSNWGICAISLFSSQGLIKDLRNQEHLFSVVEKGSESTNVKVIGSIKETLHPALDGVEAVLEKFAEPQIAIISTTITEKGYCIDPATGTLDTNNPVIIEDIAQPNKPKSALGYIVQGLKLRRDRQLPPVTVMSCDNLQENGRVAKQAVLAFARLVEPELSQWIENNVSFPNTMVDRIVPATTPETLDEIARLVGVNDPCGVACEPFRQWVIEDNFVAGRPSWDLAGAQFVDNVAPYEEMKLRMLNGSHSFLAYLGYLAGYSYISDTMHDEGFKRTTLELMMNTQAPSLNMPNGTDLNAYANKLIDRFSNSNLKHKTWQIAMDGSQKIPQRFAGSLSYHLENGSDFFLIALAIAGWMKYVSAKDEQGNDIDVRDPMAENLKRISEQHGSDSTAVPALLSIESIFPTEIGSNPRVIDAVTRAYQTLIENGSKATINSVD